jgi:SNF2 family DNA or RNA helicase
MYKDWSEQKIDRRLAKLDPQPMFITTPRHHQKICFYLMVKFFYTLPLLDLGLGKTKLVLDAFRWFKDAGKLHRILVAVPNVVNLEGWRLEIAKHAPDLTASYLEGNKQQRLEALEEETDLCLATYSGLNHIICGRSDGKMQIDQKKLSKVSKLFDGIVWDEITQIMNHRSLQYKIATKLSRDYVFRNGLTGTPFGRKPEVLWPQFFAVDRGASLGETLGIFRQTFFNESQGYWGGVERTFKSRMTKDLHRLMAHSSIRYSADECLDLPPKVMVDRPFVMTDEQWSYYQAILDQVKETRGNKLLDVSGIFIRLRQITAGFVSLEGEPSALSENPKLDSLMELIGELPENEKVVVFNEFVWSGNQIEDALKARKIKTARLYSGTKDKKKELRRFMDDPACRVFIVNSQSGAHGLNLQGGCKFVIMYESPVSPIVRKQAEGRVWRQGQEQTVFVYDLFAKNTVDQKILRFLAEGKNLFEALVEGNLSLLERD